MFFRLQEKFSLFFIFFIFSAQALRPAVFATIFRFIRGRFHI